MTLEPLYKIKVTCANCENEFETSRVRPSLKKAYRTDTDFCGYYKNENPDFYVVRVCPECGFASTENSVESLNERQKSDFRTKISSRWVQRDFGEHRSLGDALETYKLALLCAQTIREKERIIASLLHHIAWLYRYQGNEKQEKRFLAHCLDSYIRVYEVEGVGANDARLLYLIGEINRRLGRYNEAVQWFSRVIQDKKIVDSAMIRASREQWTAVREQMKAEKMALPEETGSM
ncbi:DUF2225 domain-containing protein [Paenibacillus sp. DMB20]|uniref:DUF2225 domain-containing protein n=1 Tax=Paenibacillus sp. DMB20 TaxID=1642570 RepID=UPI000627C456|nr:DUF2225 domain-containing protein [Paenibacillus sp. DMB20]KKO51183.1 hypothetical protein XI25_28025 [Paenibacillus sp. DMB20]